jgi:luciferase family oxidoreductase group 1
MRRPCLPWIRGALGPPAHSCSRRPSAHAPDAEEVDSVGFPDGGTGTPARRVPRAGGRPLAQPAAARRRSPGTCSSGSTTSACPRPGAGRVGRAAGGPGRGVERHQAETGRFEHRELDGDLFRERLDGFTGVGENIYAASGPLPAGSAHTGWMRSPGHRANLLGEGWERVGIGVTCAPDGALSVALARRAEALGYHRIWYAEHHNMRTIASSATSVLIAHVAAHTEHIRLGAGGIMLPNHAPLLIAEQFGTLESLHPGRIDLGLGRAPGSDQQTMRALRRDHRSAERFPQDVLELQGYLRGESRIPGVDAVPGKGTNVPLFILGSSLFGARLAAAMGLPYSFASHFAPTALEEAVATYREEFAPSAQLAEPYVIVGANMIASADEAEAREELEQARRKRVKLLFGGGRRLTDEDIDSVLASPAGRQVDEMLRYTAVGTPERGARLPRLVRRARRRRRADRRPGRDAGRAR